MDGETFGTDKGIGGNIIGKIALGDKGNWRATVSASYNLLKSYLFGSKPTLADQGESSFNAFTFGLGLEDNFTPNHNFKIYASFELTASMINGKAKMWVDNRPNEPYTYDVKFKNSFRVGYSVGGGTEYLLNENIGLNIGVRFSHLNLIGKQAVDIKTAPIAGETLEIALPDGSSKTSVLFSGDKNFAFFTIQAGICFYWGINEKRYKIGL
jgi:opacity protein-like surface antigen